MRGGKDQIGLTYINAGSIDVAFSKFVKAIEHLSFEGGERN